ncbi:MAG: sigma-70 family RNA polymerase sigma factor [Akkermansiaceae bacterium]
MDDEVTQQAEFVGQIARHQAALHAFIISLMPGMDGVDDVLQETNLVLWEKRKTFESGTNFKAWACTIARFKVMGHRRQLAKLGHQLFDEDLAAQLVDECEAGPAELDERIGALQKCLGRLGEDERRLIEHRYQSNSRLNEFAEKCGRSVDSLRVSLFRIRAALKKCITSEMNIRESRI